MEASGRTIVKRKRLNKPLIALLVLLILAIIILAVVVAVLAHKLKNKEVDQCDTAECAVVAGEMLSRMDLNADPCVDFYQYACGTYASPSTRPPDVSHMFTFGAPSVITAQQLAADLASPGYEYRGRDSTAVAKVKEYYSVCMNDKGDDVKGRQVLLNVIKGLKYWPLSTDPGTWNPATWNLQDVMEEVMIQNFPALLGIGLVNHPSDSDKYVLGMVAQGLTLQQAEYYNIPTAEKAYRDLVEAICILLYGPSNIASYKEWSQKIWSFEKSLTEIYPAVAELATVHSVSHIMNISEAQKKVTFLNVVQLLNKGFEGSGKTITQDNEILVGTARYFERLSNLIINLGNEAKETLAAYIVWTAMYKASDSAGKSFEEAHLLFAQTLLGAAPSMPPAWKRCTTETIEALGFAAGAVHAQEHFHAEDKDRIAKFLQITIDEFIVRLPQADWLNEVTRKKAEEKARAVVWQIGYPEVFDDPQKLDEYYESFTVFGTRCENKLEFSKFQHRYGSKKYGNPVDKKEWMKMPTETNAYYFSPGNQIVILGGILQKPIYSRSFPLSVFYGAMGSVVAHELIHGFDTSGRKYDLNGKVLNWWDPESARAYDERANCFRDQYNALTFQGHPVNGNLSVGENIADCGGVGLAYSAYTKATRGKVDAVDKILPGLKMTGSQQFFLAFAQIWCLNVNDAIATRLAVEDEHSQGPVRVNTVLKNTPEFAQVFSCPSSSQMNPNHRCTIW